MIEPDEFEDSQGAVESWQTTVTRAVNTQRDAINAVDADLSVVTESLARSWNKITALWIFAAGGYLTGLAGILLAVLT